MSGPKEDDAERDSFKRAFGDVKPLRTSSPKRAPRDIAPRVRRAPTSVGRPVEALVVEREANGIITGRRASTHASIVDALEDPRLEVDAELDLHGLTTREAEREVLRFVQDGQRRGRRWVCIVVGKGLHSRDRKGALREHVVETLTHGAPSRFVLAFRTAPRRLGGTGALVARLADRA